MHAEAARMACGHRRSLWFVFGDAAHLYRIFPKLGVVSRAELHTVVSALC